MTNGEKLESIPTLISHAHDGDYTCFGWSVSRELAGSETVASMMGLSLSGRRLAAEDHQILEDLSVVLTYADPRIWPCKVTRLVASYGRVLPAVVAGNLCLEGDLIGPWTTKYAASNLVEVFSAVLENVDDLESIEAETISLLEQKRRLVGYGVPFRETDQRLTALAARVRARNRDRRPYWRLQEAMSNTLRQARGLEPNLGIGVAAVCLDLGFTPEEISPLVVALNQNVFFSNAYEGAKSPPSVLRRLPARTVEYLGAAARTSPRFQAAANPPSRKTEQ